MDRRWIDRKNAPCNQRKTTVNNNLSSTLLEVLDLGLLEGLTKELPCDAEKCPNARPAETSNATRVYTRKTIEPINVAATASDALLLSPKRVQGYFDGWLDFK